MELKIIFNSLYKDAPATMNYSDAFSFNENIYISDSNNYEEFNIALFMPYGKDQEALLKTKKLHPHIKVGLIDPRGTLNNDIIQAVDFFIVDSIEMTDFLSKYSKPYCIFYEYPHFETNIKKQENREHITIAYHGNKVHLEEMHPRVTNALFDLSMKYPLEFIAIYNVEQLRKWDFDFPTNFKIQHVQWYEGVYNDVLASADIGIIPALIPSVDSNDSGDYNLNFKMPSNPGRLIVLTKLGIPVVADFLPSHFQFIDHGINGFLAYSTSGWYSSLENLILNPSLRKEFATKMLIGIKDKIDYKTQNFRLNKFLLKLLND